MVIDALAREMGKEPHEIRLVNLVRPDQMPYKSVTNKLIDSGDYPTALRRAVEMIDLAGIRARQRKGEPDGRLIGIGYSCFYEQTAYGTGPFGYAAWGIELVPGAEPAVARLTGDGQLVVEVGSHSHGQGHETVFAQIASDILGIDYRHVSVRYGDTFTSPAGTGTYTSRSVVVNGGAVAQACRLLKRPIAKIGAHLLKCAESEVQIRDSMVIAPAGAVSFAEIARAWYHHPENLPPDMDPAGLTVTTSFKPQADGGVYSYSMHAAVVAVDPATGHVELIDYVIVADCGTRINPMLVEGQIVGGWVNGVGNALYEESTYDENGQPTATTLADYKAPTAGMIPDVRLDFMETPSPWTQFGEKGVGENGAVGPPAAIANAVNDALRPLGASIYETPMTPRRVLAAIRAAGKKP